MHESCRESKKRSIFFQQTSEAGNARFPARYAGCYCFLSSYWTVAKRYITEKSFWSNIRWTANKPSQAFSCPVLTRSSHKMATQSSDEDSEDSLPRYGWRVHLDNTFSLKPQPCYLPRWSQIPRLLGLGWRYYATPKSDFVCLCFLSIRRPADCMHAVNISAVIFRFMKYATRERKNGRVPFIDPFSTNPCRQVYGMSNLAEVT